MRTLALAALLMGALLAGCSSPSKGPATGPEPSFDDLGLQATSSTGVIRGVVVDDAIRPIAGAKVTLMGDAPKEAVSTDQGTFGFDGLPAATYFVKVHKAGFTDAQQSADVVAGVADPPIVKVQLLADPANQPFTEILQWTAFLECGGAIPQVGSTNPCAVADSDNVHDFAFGGGRVPDFVQAEAIWTGTQPAGNYLSMGFYVDNPLLADWKGVDGESPLTLNAQKSEIQEAAGDNAANVTVRLFPGTGPGGTNPTLVLNQQYDIYVTNFYGFVPRDGWTLAADGACNDPDQCGA
jgi:hypothetical protein